MVIPAWFALLTQRFGSKLTSHVHFHALVPDGVFAEGADGSPKFHPLPKLTDEDVLAVAKRIARRVLLLVKEYDDQEEPTVLDGLRAQEMTAASSQSESHSDPGRLCALVEGFSLQAARHLHQHDREGLEALCRYGLRPAISLERLSEGPGGELLLRLKRPLPDGTTVLKLTPMTLLSRLASIVAPLEAP